MDWQDLLTAFALFLVLEGIVPFINPGGFKRYLAGAMQMQNQTLRRLGIASMAAGVLLLYIVR